MATKKAATKKAAPAKKAAPKAKAPAKKAELKTQKNEASVDKFIGTIKDKTRHDDALRVIDLMKKVTKAEPKMWGSSIIGFGSCVLKYDSGRVLDWFPVGFSPRKEHTVLYLNGGAASQTDLLAKLGKYKTGKGCLYIKNIDDVDTKVLSEMIRRGVESSKGKK